MGEPHEFSAFSTLPLDIYDLIVDAVAELPRAVSSATLLSLTRVSRAWRSAAQSALFRDPYLSFDAPDRIEPRTHARLQDLNRTLLNRLDLAAAVAAFDLGSFTSRCLTEAKVDRRLVSRTSIELVRACPKLRHLSLPFVVKADKADLLAALRTCCSLTSFTFGSGASVADFWVININPEAQEQWGTAVWTRGDFRSLAASWPSLKRVVLEARVRGREHEEPIPWQLDTFELALLKSHKLRFSYLDKLLASSRPTLRRLVLKEHQLHPPDLVLLIQEYGATLESLETTTSDRFRRNDAFANAIASACPNLRTLRLGTPIYDLEATLSLFSHLCSLKHLTLDTVLLPRNRPSRQAPANVVRNFLALRRLSLTTGHHDDPATATGEFSLWVAQLREMQKALEGEVEVVLRSDFS
ncbi:hypothetical protein JCM10207_005361 [Rhodosporidiobolus poonsookiae]